MPGPVGVTLRPDGFLWRKRLGEHRIPAPMAFAIGTLAAGDVWHTASTRPLVEGRDVPGAGFFSNSAAKIRCSRIEGPLGTPRRDEVMTRPSARRRIAVANYKTFNNQSIVIITHLAMQARSFALVGHLSAV